MGILRPMSRVFRFTLRFLAISVLLLLLAVGGILWKMTEAPLASTDLTPYVEAIFARLVPGTKAEVGKSSVTWDNDHQIVALTCESARLYDADHEMVALFPSASLRLSVWSFLRGRVLPLELKADNAQFWVKRRKDGAFTLGEGTPQPAKASDDLRVFSVLSDIGDEIATDHLNHTIAINEAKINVYDERVSQNWTLTVREISLNHTKDKATGEAKIEVTQKDRTAFLNASYHFDFVTRFHQVAMSFQDIRLPAVASQHPRLAALATLDLPLSGTFSFGMDRGLNVSAVKLNITGGAGFLTNKEFWDKPRAVKSLVVEAHYDEIKDQAKVSRFDIDFGGPKLGLTAEAKTPVDPDLLWMKSKKKEGYTVTIKLQDLPMDQFASVWPKPLIPDAQEWMEESLTKGVYKQGTITLKGKLKWNDLANSTLDTGSGRITAQGGRVLYMVGMPAVDDVDAEATFTFKKMDVTILKGHTGPIKVKPFTLHMTDLDKETQFISIPLELEGPVPDVLRLLDSPPLGYAKAMGLKAADSSGQVSGTLSLKMPLLESLLLKDIDISAQARFKNLGLRNLVPHIEVTKGDLAFELGKSGFGLKGPVALNKVPMDLTWSSHFKVDPKGKEPLHEATVTGTIKGKQWAAFGIDDRLEAKGKTSVRVHYKNMRKGFSNLQGTADFKRAELIAHDLNWTKPKGASAKLKIEMEMQDEKDLNIKTIDFQGKGIKAKGSAELDARTGEIRQMTLDPFILGRTNASVWFSSPADTSQPLVIRAEGEAIDVSGFKGPKDPEKTLARPKDYQVKLTKLYTAENGFMSSVAGHAIRDKIGWSEIDFFGLAQGTTPLTIKLLPKKGVRHFSISADNFGNALKGLGFSESVKGGDIQVDGESSPEEPRAIKGNVKIGSFTVSGLPVLARLLSAVSPFGFVDLITGDASFDHLRGEYKWFGDQIDLSKLRAAGSVVGINLEGRVNIDSGAANLNGTVVPFSFVNSIIGSIPLLGDVITGGEGQGVIAASFTIRGTMSNPDVSVNPVSLLTPGFLRNLFFSYDEGEGQTPPAEEKK